MALQVAEVFKIPVNRVAVRVSGWNLTHESDGTINDYGIGSNKYMILADIGRLLSKCEKCENMNDCSFPKEFKEWQHKTWIDDKVVISTEAYYNVCKKYKILDKVKKIEGHSESPFVRFVDAAHHAFHHHNMEFNWDEITKIAQKN